MNPYETKVTLGTDRFLETAYILMRKKVTRLIEIEKSKKKNKLPLPLIKEKFEITSNILKAIMELTKNIDYSKPEGNELSDILNDIGLLIGRGNIAENGLKDYEMTIIILNAFLEVP